MKLAVSPPTPARSRIAPMARCLLLGREDGIAEEPLQVGALLDHLVEAVEIGGDRVDGTRLLRQLEQGRGVARRHARQEGSFLRTALSHERLSQSHGLSSGA